MPNRQICVRTQPYIGKEKTKSLNDYLSRGYKVVLCNRYICDIHNGDVIYANEYILEKEVNGNAE